MAADDRSSVVVEAAAAAESSVAALLRALLTPSDGADPVAARARSIEALTALREQLRAHELEHVPVDWDLLPKNLDGSVPWSDLAEESHRWVRHRETERQSTLERMRNEATSSLDESRVVSEALNTLTRWAAGPGTEDSVTKDDSV